MGGKKKKRKKKKSLCDHAEKMTREVILGAGWHFAGENCGVIAKEMEAGATVFTVVTAYLLPFNFIVM